MTQPWADMKLGRRKPDKTKPRLQFGNFIGKTAPIPDHPIVSPAPGLVYPMDLNDQVGDCVVAAWDHFRQIVTQLLTGSGRNFTDDEIIEFYRTQNPGFNLNDPAHGPGSDDDQGMVIQDFLAYLAKQGYILGFAAVDEQDEELMQAAVYLGLGVIIGVDLQTAQQTQTVWDYSPSRDWGGHCVVIAGYHPTDTVVTWGTLVDATQRFLTAQCDEAWFVITQDHVNHPGFRNQFDLAGFAAAYTAITGRPFPVDVPPTPTPTPTPTPGPDAPFQLAITDPELVAHILRSADTKQWAGDVNAWAAHHFQTYFK